ncbi:MAG: 6-phosphogluconolactonase [Verrucomicrobium sp.]|nr:6-phosphogluconolactonase [Verrucomicrobium sp.]
MASTPHLRVFPDPGAVARAAADLLLKESVAAAAANRTYRVALSGGSTPKRLYDILATDPYRDKVPWDRIHFFFSDERNVPPDHADSNFGTARQGLFSKVPVPAANLHRVLTERPDPAEAAALYQNAIVASFAANVEKNTPPTFDLIFLGMGADGHTASLFPGTPALAERKHWVAANWVEKLQTHRITFTYPLLNRAARVLFLVTGADKAERIETIFGPQALPHAYPAQDVAPEPGLLEWYLDAPAAARLSLPVEGEATAATP